ncbi:EthD domain-containing protein, partial [Paraphoma chrysanthemicola]
MAISVMVLYTRRPDFSPDQFKTYMEHTHLPIIKEVMGTQYPVKYPRRYIERVQSGAGDRLGAPGASRKNCDPEDPVMLVGSPKTLEWDMMGEMIFRDELHLQQCLAIVNSMEGQKIKDDEENFTVPHLLKVALMG